MKNFFKSICEKIFKPKPGVHEKYQCESRSSSSAEFNCCIRKAEHKGLHMSADGNTWF